jgi:KEOPS complex subunit Cgi121
MLKIIGAKGNISDLDKFLKQIGNFSQKNKVTIQAFDADTIFGKDHLVSAVEHAVRAMNRKTNTTNSLEMEILLYASGERQLKLAIPKMGVKEGNVNVAFAIVDKTSEKSVNEMLKMLSLVRDDKILEGSKDTLKKFGITEDEIKTVTKAKYGDLILEKVAMVDIIK